MSVRKALLVAGVAWGVSLLLQAGGVLRRFEDGWTDVIARWRQDRPLPENLRIVVAADDDDSFAADMGTWPWDRRAHAQVIDCLRQGGARQIVFDILFDGRGRTDDGDQLLLETSGRAGNVTVGSFMDLHDGASNHDIPQEIRVRHSLPAPAGSGFPRASRILFPFDGLTESCAVGFLNAPHEPDGVIRHAYALLEYEGRLYPSLAFATCLAYDGVPIQEVRVTAPKTIEYDAARRGRVVLHLDDVGRLRLDYRGSLEALRPRSVSGLLLAFEERGAEGLAEYRDRIVLLGSVHSAGSDLCTTPLAPVEYGMFVQATAIANFMDGSFLRDSPAGTDLVLALVWALAGAGGAFVRRKALRAIALVGIVVAPFLLAWLLVSRAGLCLPVLGIVTAGAFASGGVTASRVAAALRERREVERVFQGFLPHGVLADVLRNPRVHLERVARCDVSILEGKLTGLEDCVLAPEEEAALLRELFSACVRVIHGCGGTVLRLSTERVFALFNEPGRIPAHARAAAQAAFGLIDAVGRTNSDWIGRARAPIGLACALTSGITTVGMVGSDFHREYTAFGKEVSHAGRLLDRATEGQVVGNARFEALVRGDFVTLLVDEEPDGGGVFLLSLPDPRNTGRAAPTDPAG